VNDIERRNDRRPALSLRQLSFLFHTADACYFIESLCVLFDVTNQYVTTGNRSSDIRVEIIVQTAYDFLSERLQEEQNEVMKKLLSAHCLKDFVDSGLDICEKIYVWDSLSSIHHLPVDSDTICSSTKYAACISWNGQKTGSVYRNFGASLHAKRKNCVASQ